MRKVIIPMIIISALVLAGCGNGGQAPKTQESSTKATNQAGNNTGQEQKANDATQPGTNSTAMSPGSSNSNKSTEGPAIIAKSGNIMSSSDKAALLNQVDKELDSLFKSINSLDDAQDSDLNLNQK